MQDCDWMLTGNITALAIKETGVLKVHGKIRNV